MKCPVCGSTEYYYNGDPEGEDYYECEDCQYVEILANTDDDDSDDSGSILC